MAWTTRCLLLAVVAAAPILAKDYHRSFRNDPLARSPDSRDLFDSEG